MAKTYEVVKFLDTFVRGLNFILESKSLFLNIVVLSTYSEYITNQLIKKHFGYGLDDDISLGQSTKLKFLIGGDIIKDSEYKTLDALRQARNLVVHCFSIDQDKLDNILKKVEINYLDGEAKKSLEFQPIVVRFIHGCIIKIFYLITKFYNIERTLNYANGKYQLLKPDEKK